MTRGDVPTSPWFEDFHDTYIESVTGATSVLTITVPWDDSVGGTRNILDGTVIHRDVNCRFDRIVFDNPNPGTRKPLPAVPVGDTVLTAQQVRQGAGFRTIDDLLAVQITAEI